MKFNRLFIGLFVLILNGCLELPAPLAEQVYLDSVSLILISEQGDSSKILMAPQESSFTLSVQINPEKSAQDLNFSWLAGDTLLSKNKTYFYSPKKTLPDSVLIFDAENNQVGLKFSVVLNSPPQFLKWIEPTNRDTLYGNSQDAFLFAWQATDVDKDSLNYFIVRDSSIFPTGPSNRIWLSGFSIGSHALQVIVQDSKSIADTSQKLWIEVQEPK